ncbi:MAG: amino acid ABC transporter substrate-binding protein [Burkholderiaceae bacterium]|nr:amino acid ABC transporter substrate-binding protein [Burkholderiaceae bacterium]
MKSLVRIFLLGTAAAACGSVMAASAVLDSIKAGGPLLIGHRESSVPFSYLDQGKPIGYAVDLCLKIAESIKRKANLANMKVEFVPVNSANRVNMVESGKVHMECGSTTNNAERRQKVAFTIPHFITGARLLVRSDSTITRIEDVEGKNIVSTAGSTPLKAVQQADRERLLRLKILAAPDHEKAVQMVEKGEAEAFVMDDVLLYGLAASRAKPDALKVVGKFLTTEPLAIMLPKGDADFKKMVDDEMRRLITSGEINPMYDKWFIRPIPPRNVSLNLPQSYLLKDFWKYPTDYVPF